MSRLSTFLEQYPDAEIRGGMILAIQHAMGEVALPYFEQAGLGDIQADDWYSMARYLKVLYDIVKRERGVMTNLVAIGMSTTDHALLPPEIDTLEKGLMALQQGWRMNSRNAKEVIWSVQKTGDNTFICSSYSPFPTDQEYGVLYGFTRRFAKNCRFTVAYENLVDRGNEDKEEIRFLVKTEQATG